MACQHEPPFQKRFIFDRLVLRGGLALVPHKFGDLKIAESIDDGLLRTFLQYPNADVLPSRLPPSLSWSFTSGETVIYVPEGTELQDVVKGDEGVIQRDGSLECEVLFSRSQVNISVLKRHLQKTWRLAQVVELSPHTPEGVLRQTGIITKVRLDEVDVWITGINSICTIHPNSVREVVESSVSPGLKSRFQPRLSNVGATIALKPSLLGIQRYGNLDQKADLAKIAASFISHEVNRFDLRRGEYRVQNCSTAMTSMLTSVDQMSSFLNPTIPSTLFGYVVTEGVVPHTDKGYIHRHREDELPVTNLSTDPTNADGSRTLKSHWTAIDYSVPAWDPSSRTPNPYASSSSLTMSTPPAKHWILDSRICKGLGGREIWVNV
ncbi:hypothetical protein DFH05DRAFT_1529800 [Lentinula detonsa]|uniref:Uncharacterized protein n=1 Tax=Lentinula detonsa TaxID=2804962 RepID=A0A9W8NSL1_9AGAR|nr:hypothetical protein DFH05DRAFT_1529800 [Lentinula detonsa]